MAIELGRITLFGENIASVPMINGGIFEGGKLSKSRERNEKKATEAVRSTIGPQGERSTCVRAYRPAARWPMVSAR